MTTMTLAPQFRSTSPLAPARSTPPAGAARLRLTRRGRVVVLGGGLMLALGLGLGLSANSSATEFPATLSTVTVGPGETLWGIAASVSSDGRTGDMVQQIKELNGLAGGSLQAGQKIRVPVVD